jgi:hypothetical protein
LRVTVKDILAPIACALAPILCYAVIRPYAEIGIIDDWSYVKTAQILARTGHIAYNGWATAMLGWQLYFGAFLVKLFGFSFTAVRFSTVIVAMATAFLLQRAFIRAGLNSWNATLATMTFVLSPLYLPLAFTFMSDVPGVFCIVVCLYMCLRSLQAESERSAMAWVCLAALLNGLGGTVRQIAWLGVLVMVPSTLWLLRRNRRAFEAGCVSCIAGIGIMTAAMHWFARQPYNVPESPIPPKIDLESLKIAGRTGLHAVADLALLALPVLLMFAGSLRRWNRRGVAIFITGFVCLAILGIALVHKGKMQWYLAPFLLNFMTFFTFERLDAALNAGLRLPIANDFLRPLLTGAVALGLLCLVTFSLSDEPGVPAPQGSSRSTSWQTLGILLGPFCVAYFALLIPRAMKGGLYDRYLLPLLAIAILLLARYYQEKVRENLPWVCVILIFLTGAFSVAATHDKFSLSRGYLSAIDQIESKGIPATAILGPWEFDGWVEVEKVGHVNDPRIQVPQDAYVVHPVPFFPGDCNHGSLNYLDEATVDSLGSTPAINPVYAIFLEPGKCGGQVAFPPVVYRTWISPHVNSVYTIRMPPSDSQ